MESVFLKACRREKTPFTPIWLMRQIGRYMPEYQRLREKVSFLELCKSPELVTEVTVTAATQLNVDAAIIFADILLITEPLGFQLTFEKGDGPKIHNPFRTSKDLKNLKTPNSKQSLSFLGKAISKTVQELNGKMPVIGFAGAPFTVASYTIEGGSSKTFENTKTLMRSDPPLWNEFLAHITDATIEYLHMQIEAGAEAIQLFDSWIGCINKEEYRGYVLPHVKRIFSSLPKTVPAIYFGTGTGPFLKDFAESGASVIGIDFHIQLDQAWNEIGPKAIQGNLDPTILLGLLSVIET